MLELGKELDMEGSRELGCNSVLAYEAHTKPQVPSPRPSHAQAVGRKNGVLPQRALLELHSDLMSASSQALHTQMLTAVQEISNLIEPLASAARAEASQLGHKVRKESCEELRR